LPMRLRGLLQRIIRQDRLVVRPQRDSVSPRHLIHADLPRRVIEVTS